MAIPRPPAPEIHNAIDFLIDNLINITDESGKFLLHLADGRIIDTKCWAGWEWTHGIGLYGVWKYYEMTGDEKLLNRPEYVAEAKRQFLVHIKYLFDTKTGLFFHGWTFEDGGHNFANARWARGNSWVTIVIPEIIELLELKHTDPIRIHLIDTLEAQVETLSRLQSQSGGWNTLLDHSDSYLEASATAGFAYGILKAVRKRYISAKYKPIVEKAIASVLKDVDDKGELQNTSFGTGMGDSLQFYKDIPLTVMPYGQAMAIMALGEYLRTYI